MDCKLCQKYAKGKGCTADGCPWLAERIQAGAVDNAEAVREAFPRDDSLNARLHTVIRRFTGSVFLSAAHRQRMERTKKRMGRRKRRDTPAYSAEM